MTMLELFVLTLIGIGFGALYELWRIRQALDMIEAIQRKQMFG
jgi:hypothetical protein